MKAFSLIIKSVLVAGLLTASGVSQAIPIISGSIGMGGSFNPVDSSGTIVDLDEATGIDFAPNMFRVSAGSTGDFAALAGMDGTIQDLQFAPFSSPIVDFWTVGDFAFELTMLDDLTALGFESMFLVLSGEGIISGDGYQDTLGSWTFAGTGGGGIFTWAAVSAAEGGGGGTQDDYMSVPEPMALALIGIGLVGFGGVRGFRGRRAPGKK